MRRKAERPHTAEAVPAIAVHERSVCLMRHLDKGSGYVGDVRLDVVSVRMRIHGEGEATVLVADIRWWMRSDGRDPAVPPRNSSRHVRLDVTAEHPCAVSAMPKIITTHKVSLAKMATISMI